MRQSLLAGLIGAAFTFGGYWAGGFVHWDQSPNSSGAALTYEVHKAGSLNVPVVRRGELRGYIVVQLAYSYDGKAGAFSEKAIEALLQDEAFRTLYSDQAIDWRTLATYDLKGLTQKLLKRIKERAPPDVIKDVLINEFSFVPISSLK